MTPKGLEEIRKRHRAIALAQRSGKAEAAELSVLNREFHFAIYAQSSPLIPQYIEVLWVRFIPSATIWSPVHAADLQSDHDLILDKIARGDAASAGELTAMHIRRAAAIREREPDLRAAGRDDGQALPAQ